MAGEEAETARRIQELREQHRAAITVQLGRAAGNGHKVLESLFDRPIVAVNNVQKLTGSEDARKMLMTVLDAEVRAFIQVYADERTQQGRRLVVRDGQLPPRQIMTGAGPFEVEQPRVRDRRGKGVPQTVRFISKVLPPYLSRSQSVTDICPWLYLKGISTGGFQKALQSLVRADAADLSASTVSRLTPAWAEEHEAWSNRDLR